MSKVSFRARQIDFNKPLPIIKCEDGLLPDIGEYAAINRGVPNMPTGMEKEEETEHHLQEALTALQQYQTTENIAIPVPDSVEVKKAKGDVYTISDYHPPKQLIHIQTLLFDDEHPVDYDMDSEDEEWLQKSNLGISSLQFEMLIDRLEKGCGHKVMSLDEARSLLREDPSLVIAIYDYWLTKRVRSRQPMILTVKQERRDGSNNSDPYVAFRRRTEKMQTRKNRKNDEQSYEKMVRLKLHMQRLGDIVDLVLKRDKGKEKLIDTKRSIFISRYSLSDWDGLLLRESEIVANKQRPLQDPLNGLQNDIRGLKETEDIDRRQSRKRRRPNRAAPLRSFSSDVLSDTEEGSDVDGAFTFVRLPGCVYRKPKDMLNPLDSSLISGDRSSFQLTTLPGLIHSRRQQTTSYVRRRLGRGGRIIYDRVTTEDSRYLDTFADASFSSDDEDSPNVCQHPSRFRPAWSTSKSRSLRTAKSHTTTTNISSILAASSNEPSFSVSPELKSGVQQTIRAPNGSINELSKSITKLNCIPSAENHVPVSNITTQVYNRAQNGPNRSPSTPVLMSLQRPCRPVPAVPVKNQWVSPSPLLGLKSLQKTHLGCHPMARQSWTEDVLHDSTEELT